MTSLENKELTWDHRHCLAVTHRVAGSNHLKESLDVRVRIDVMTSYCQLEPEHLGDKCALLWIHLSCKHSTRAWHVTGDLRVDGATEQADRWAIKIADQAHVEHACITVVIDPTAGLRFDNERERRVKYSSTVRKLARRTVMAFDGADHDTADFDDDTPDDCPNLFSRDASIHQDAFDASIAKTGAPVRPQSSCITEVIEGGWVTRMTSGLSISSGVVV